MNPAVVPYYRDDACLDDGTGDDPVQRPWPGEASTDPRVQDGYCGARKPAVHLLGRSTATLDLRLSARAPGARTASTTSSPTTPTTPRRPGRSPRSTRSSGSSWCRPRRRPTSAQPLRQRRARAAADRGGADAASCRTLPPVARRTSPRRPIGGHARRRSRSTALDLDTCELTFAIVDAAGARHARRDRRRGVHARPAEHRHARPSPTRRRAGFSGSDSFTYTVNDGTTTSLAATVSITVTPQCGDGVTDAGEQCDAGPANGAAGSCCSATCAFVAAGTTCRAAGGVCDVAGDVQRKRQRLPGGRAQHGRVPPRGRHLRRRRELRRRAHGLPGERLSAGRHVL